MPSQSSSCEEPCQYSIPGGTLRQTHSNHAENDVRLVQLLGANPVENKRFLLARERRRDIYSEPMHGSQCLQTERGDLITSVSV